MWISVNYYPSHAFTMAWYSNGASASHGVSMAPCECIVCLPLSSLRDVFDATCRYLYCTDWTLLWCYFSKQQMLDKEDTDAISNASKLSTPTPVKEMILRLERHRGLTIGTFLKHLQAAIGSPQYMKIAGWLFPLHVPNCRASLGANSHYAQLSPTPAHAVPDVSDLSRHHQREDIFSSSDMCQTHLRIVKHPMDTTVEKGGELILNCVAESNKSMTFSWKRDGKTLHGFTGKVLMLAEIEPSHGGNYECVVSSGSLQVISKPAKVSVGYVASDKFALLIANESYTHISTLSSATNDVRALAATLRDELNFKTMTLVNLTLPEIKKAIRVFRQHLINGAYCVTYLAGHGFENDGQCYIVPVDAPHRYSSHHCYSIRKMIEDIRTSCKLNLAVFLLDVCRRHNRNAAVTFTEDNGRRGRIGNYIISYATVEHGMAYEVKGRELGIYVSSLQKYLARDERVMRVLELVHQDIHKDWNAQQPEFKSNIFEDRKLTDLVDALVTDSNYISFCNRWQTVHVRTKPTLFIFESCGAEVGLYKTCLFSNKLSLEVKVLDSGKAEGCTAFILLQGYPEPRVRMDIENLQRLLVQHVPLTISLHYKLESTTYRESWDDSIHVPFVSWWNEG